MVCTIPSQWALDLCLLSTFLPVYLRWVVPRSRSLRTGLFSRPSPHLGIRPKGAMIHVQQVAQPGICSCRSPFLSRCGKCCALLVYVPMVRESANGVVPLMLAFQSRQLLCGPFVGYWTQLPKDAARSCEIFWCNVGDSLNMFRDQAVSSQHAFSFQSLSALCTLSTLGQA